MRAPAAARSKRRTKKVCPLVPNVRAIVARARETHSAQRACESDQLPRPDVVAILDAREFCNPEMPLGIHDGRFWARTAKGRAGSQEHLQPFIDCRVFSVHIRLRAPDSLFPTHADARKAARHLGSGCRETGRPAATFVPDRPGPKCVVNAEQIIRLAEAHILRNHAGTLVAIESPPYQHLSPSIGTGVLKDAEHRASVFGELRP